MLAIAGLFFCLGSGAVQSADPVVLSTLEWPPFASSHLRDFGATSSIIREAFDKQGYEVRFVFDAWPVSVDMARTGKDGVVAYFPGYHCRHRENFLASDPIGSSPLGLAERVDAPVSWRTLDDLGEQQLKIGTVLGYTNTEEFDRRVGMGWIRAIPSDNDTENLRKLLRGRIDAAVIDQYVFRYLTSTVDSLAPGSQELQFNARPISDTSFYLCFRGDAIGTELRDAFNSGLAQIDIERRLTDYLKELTVDVRSVPIHRDPDR